MDTNEIGLWRKNRGTSRWELERKCDQDTAAGWLARFRVDEPNEIFRLAKTKPKYVRDEEASQGERRMTDVQAKATAFALARETLMDTVNTTMMSKLHFTGATVADQLAVKQHVHDLIASMLVEALPYVDWMRERDGETK